MPDGADDHLAVPFVRVGLASRSLYFSIEDVQSRMQLRDPDALDLRYTRTMMGFLMFRPVPACLLMIGLGGGSIAKFCHRHLRGTRIDVVEINPQVIALRDTFRVPADSARFRVIEADGAAFLRSATTRYDVVLLDAFGAHGLPRRLGTQRFYDDSLDALEPGGVLVSNFHSAAPGFPACLARLNRSFDGAALVVEDEDHVNSIVFAKKGGALVAPPDARSARPKGLDPAAWAQLSRSFERIATALAGRGDR
ncbi:MAG: fused MFS/spermidine synthase [Caldimonas sp.]